MNEESTPSCKEGIIREITDTEIVVAMTLSSACSGCHAKSMCGVDSKNELMRFLRMPNDHYAVGDHVNIQLSPQSGTRAVIWGYLFPLLVLIITLFVTYWLTHHELISVLFALVLTVAYYFLLHKLDKKLAKRIKFTISAASQNHVPPAGISD
jgi:sigma-E factor negative regulatory protein RseC